MSIKTLTLNELGCRGEKGPERALACETCTKACLLYKMQTLLYPVSQTLSLRRRYSVGPHVRLQRWRNHDRAIRLLIILDNGDPGASAGQPRAVQRVHEFALAALGLGAYPRAARLKCLAVRAGRNLAEFSARGQPHLDVVSLGRGKAHVCGAQEHDAVVQPELLENDLGVAHQFLVLLVALLGPGKLEQLHLLKLVLAHDAAGVFPCGAGLRPEAGCPGTEVDGQRLSVHCFFAVQIAELDLGSRRQPQIRPLDMQ